jgi:hypothetical protein
VAHVQVKCCVTEPFDEQNWITVPLDGALELTNGPQQTINQAIIQMGQASREKFLAFYGTRRLNTEFTRARNWPLP